ncbi:helix-turn-helix transcriptional regulator [Citrobacter freundii]|uniref:helix-turn-helix domain-containing protein n=1 Tax=Citrobacter portucalensis TaxID=1639133 RepID=UPI0017DF08D5|nr:helix-turn-helix transcriptional regulator [Citrobacter portucalensis]MBA8563531.1 helix-turn-helix transcriptional regulator [Citrobacter freundii]MBI1681680.1 helix-turn-helix domain-containing protein [Citrobacter portucalensis]
MIRGQDLSSSGHTIGSIDDSFMEPLAQKQWNSFPDNSMTELPQDVFFRSYVLEANHHVPQHSHSFMQFHFARKGSMRIDVAGKCWIIPAHYGIWIPNNTEHAVWALDDVYLENLDIKPGFLEESINECKVVAISDFAREFIHYATNSISGHYDSQSKEGKLVSVLVDIILQLPEVAFVLPWPQDRELTKVCRTIQESPALEHSVEYWAQHLGMSARTFSRHFKKETGLPFSVWKQKMRILESVLMLKKNKSVTAVALDVGYSSTAAFSYAFRQAFGVPPSNY